MASRRKPLEGKHWTVKRTAFMFPGSSACLCKLCIINVVITEFDLLNILRHFKCFYNVLSQCLCLKYCRGWLIWIANGQKLHFVQKYLCFIFLRGDLNIYGWETDEKLTRLCSSSMDVLPSKSSSRSRDWKLSISYSKKQKLMNIRKYVCCIVIHELFHISTAERHQ